MRSAQALLALCVLLPLSVRGGEEEKASAQPPMTRVMLERVGQQRGWKKMEFKEDGTLLVGGTCDAKKVEETFGICRQALDKACELFQVTPEQMAFKGKLWCVVLTEKKDFLGLASTPQEAETFNRVSAILNWFCIDRVYGTTPDSDRHLTAHLFTHQFLNAYQALRSGKEAPGWVTEGLAAWMDGTLLASPAACCIARVGYDEERLKDRTAGASWERTIASAVRKYSEMKEKDRITAEYTPLRNMVGKPFDNLTGTDVAASWNVVQTLAGDKKKPGAFKAFVDAVLAGGRQADAFQQAFGKTLDEFEKGWMKALAAKAVSPPDPKNKKK